jgi:AcrR family transcriptional regulator
MEFVEEQGLTQLTMRALGEKLGVDPTAVYRHFPSKEAMIEAMLDQLMAQSAAIEPAGDSPRDRILSTALDLRSIFHAHPQLSTAFATSSGAYPSGLTLTKRLITELRAIGLKNADLVQMYQTIETFIKKTLDTDGRVAVRAEALQSAIKRNQQDQDRVNERAERAQARLFKVYNSMDSKVGSLNALNSYVSQQLAAMNK